MADEGRYVYRFLDEEGQGRSEDNRNQTGDYSVTPRFFRVNPPDQGFFAIHLMTVQIRSAGMMAAVKYGDLTELTNGIVVATVDSATDAIISDLTDGQPVKSNADWARQAYDAEGVNVGLSQAGDKFFRVRWNFADAGQPIFIAKGEDFAVILNDDFSGLVDHVVQVQGFFGISAKTTESTTIRIK